MKQLDPKAVWFFFITSSFSGFLVGVLVSLSGLSAFSDPSFIDGSFGEGVLNIAKWIFLLYIIISYVFSKLTYKYYRYELREDGFRKESGIIWKKYVTIPYDRLQNVDINRGLLARILGLSDLQLHTAGAGGVAMGEGRLPALSKEVAEQLRDELIARSRAARSQGSYQGL